MQSHTAGLVTLLATYGYWAVFVGIAIESTGIPFPGETILLLATMYAGTTHQLAPVLIIAAAASGAVLGDNLGFWAGREGGYRLLRRYGHLVRLNERKVKLGLYLFHRHGGKVVFFGRFVAVLRMWAAFLAGLGGYFLGDSVHRLTGPVGIGAAVLAGLLGLAVFLFLRRHHHRLEEEAERALPGPLDAYRQGQRGERPSRLLTGQTPGHLERSGQRIGEEQATVLICETYDRVAQLSASRVQEARALSSCGQAEKPVLHKIRLVKEIVVHE